MVLACSKKEIPQEEEKAKESTTHIVHLTDDQLKQIDVQTAKLSLNFLSTTLQLNGKTTLLPENEAVVSSLIDGKLSGNKTIEGMYVRKGQTLAWIENTLFIDWQEQLLIARSKYSLAKLEWERQAELNQTKSASDKVVQQAKYAMQEQQILMQTLSNKLQMIGINPQVVSNSNLVKRIPINSPITGYVRTVSAINGTYVSPADALLTISNASNLLLKLKVYQDDMVYLNVGQVIEAKTNNSSHLIKGTIKYINASLNNEGFGEIVCSIQDDQIIPGMYLTAKVELKGKEVYAIPSEAVVEFEGKKFVYVQKNKNQYLPVEVTSSVEENNFTAITNFKELVNQPIVLKASYALLMKDKNIEDD